MKLSYYIKYQNKNGFFGPAKRLYGHLQSPQAGLHKQDYAWAASPASASKARSRICKVME